MSLLASRANKRRGNNNPQRAQNNQINRRVNVNTRYVNNAVPVSHTRNTNTLHVRQQTYSGNNTVITSNNSMNFSKTMNFNTPESVNPLAINKGNDNDTTRNGNNGNNRNNATANNINVDLESFKNNDNDNDFRSFNDSISEYSSFQSHSQNNKKSIIRPSIYAVVILQENFENFEEHISELYNQNSKKVYFKIINNNCGKYTSHKINLMEQKYSNSFNIEFTKSEESVIEIINNNIIQFLLDKSFTYFTWININNKYNKGLFELLKLNNNYFSYSNSILNHENNQIKLNKYINIEDVIDNYSGCDAFMWHRVAMKKIGLLKNGIKDPQDDYFKRTLISNFDECIFVNNSLVENNKKFTMNIENNEIINYNLRHYNENEKKEQSFNVSVIIPCIDLNKYTDSCLKYIYKNTSEENIQLILVVKDEKTKLFIETVLHKINHTVHNVHNIHNIHEIDDDTRSEAANEEINEETNDFINERNNISISILVADVKSYSEAINVGLKEAKSDYVIFMNNNIIVDVNWDKKLHDAIVNMQATAIIPITNHSKNNYNNFINISHGSIEDFFDKTRKINHLFQPLINCYQFDLFCIIFNKEELSKIGGIDKHYINSNESEDIYEIIKLFNRSAYISTDCVVYNYELTKEYSQELKVYNEYLFEKKWNKVPNRRPIASAQLTTDVYNMEIYRPKSELKDYLDANNRTRFPTETINEYINLENGFDIDSKLYKYLNINNSTFSVYNNNVYTDIYENAILKGLIYNKQQIINLMEIDNLFVKNDNYYCLVNDIYIELKLLVSKIYDKTFEDFINDIQIYENTLTQDQNQIQNQNNGFIDDENHDNINKSLVVSFIGDYKVGLFLINKLINSNKINLPIVFVFKNANVYFKLKNIISFFPNRIIIKTKEFGNDIIPTLQAVNYCLNVLNLNIDYIYKFHTKSNEVWFETLTNYLLDTSEDELIKLLNNSITTKKSNCVGDDKYYLHVNNEDKFCKQLVETYKDFYDKESFVAGTMFFTKSDLFRNIINFIKRNNYRSYFINNMYESNNINIANSPIHFLERLFGIIKI